MPGNITHNQLQRRHSREHGTFHAKRFFLSFSQRLFLITTVVAWHIGLMNKDTYNNFIDLTYHEYIWTILHSHNLFTMSPT